MVVFFGSTFPFVAGWLLTTVDDPNENKGMLRVIKLIDLD